MSSDSDSDSDSGSSGPKLQVRIVLATRSFTLDVAFDVAPGVTVLFGGG